MRIRLPPEEVAKLDAALTTAGNREIGGQIFGEQLEPSDFRVTELTIQERRGSFARFIVDLLQAARDALRFFDRTEHRYTRFNYIGEWHSHPSFDVQPRTTDAESMRRLVRDPAFRGNFAVVMIARKDLSQLTCGAWLFDPTGAEHPVTLEIKP